MTSREPVSSIDRVRIDTDGKLNLLYTDIEAQPSVVQLQLVVDRKRAQLTVQVSRRARARARVMVSHPNPNPNPHPKQVLMKKTIGKKPEEEKKTAAEIAEVNP